MCVFLLYRGASIPALALYPTLYLFVCHKDAHLQPLMHTLMHTSTRTAKPTSITDADADAATDANTEVPVHRRSMLCAQCLRANVNSTEKCLVAEVNAFYLHTPLFAWQSRYDVDQRR